MTLMKETDLLFYLMIAMENTYIRTTLQSQEMTGMLQVRNLLQSASISSLNLYLLYDGLKMGRL